MTKKQVTETKTLEASKWPGAFKAFENAGNAVLKNPQPAALFLVVYMVLAIISSNDTDPVMLTSVADLVFLLAITIYSLALADGKQLTIKSFLQLDVKKYIFLLLTGILGMLLIGVSLLLFIVPVVWTLAWVFSAGYAVADKGLNPVDAIKEGKRLAQNHKGKVWGIVGVTFLFGIAIGIINVIPYAAYLGTLALGVLTIVCSVAGAMLYRWLQANDEVAETENA
jgi:uncharacterized membrane protein